MRRKCWASCPTNENERVQPQPKRCAWRLWLCGSSYSGISQCKWGAVWVQIERLCKDSCLRWEVFVVRWALEVQFRSLKNFKDFKYYRLTLIGYCVHRSIYEKKQPKLLFEMKQVNQINLLSQKMPQVGLFGFSMSEPYSTRCDMHGLTESCICFLLLYFPPRFIMSKNSELFFVCFILSKINSIAAMSSIS